MEIRLRQEALERLMGKYVIRRVLYMAPTVFGVVLITFFLFNVAGGDPSVMKLGKQATASSLEEYDIQRGYDKPLIAGNWGSTRAYESTSFDANAGTWTKLSGVSYEGSDKGSISLTRPGSYSPTRHFALVSDTMYRWDIRCRAQGEATIKVINGDDTLSSEKLSEGAAWETVRLSFRTGADAEGVRCVVEVEDGQVEVSSVGMRKRVSNFFDSQFVHYLGQVVRFDFGVSAETNQRVSTMVKDGILPSLALTVPMFVVGIILSVSISLLCAYFRNRFIDRFFVFVTVLLMSVNYLVWIILGQYFLGYRFHVFPVWGFESWRYLLLPCSIGVVSGLGASIRFYRTIMLDEMYRDYVRTAYAKGVSKSGVMFKHVLKNAMIPILTSVVMQIPFLYTGSLLLESFFGIPGLGSLSINAMASSDFDVIKAVTLVGAVLYVVANLVTDLCYAMVDPRVKLK
jgi:peptide/nickel transport system permease protein